MGGSLEKGLQQELILYYFTNKIKLKNLITVHVKAHIYTNANTTKDRK